MHNLHQRHRALEEVDGIYGAFFSEVPVLPARAVVSVKEMHFGAHIEIQAIAFLNRP